MRLPLYHAVTHGVRVTVRPRYLVEQSRPAERHFMFAYSVRIENVSPVTVQLLTRHWFIYDSAVGESEVQGDGVVGEQPVLAPGGVFEYQSFCPLRSPQGTMHGTYRFRRDDGAEFDTTIPRFDLDADAAGTFRQEDV